MPRSGIARPCGSANLEFLRNLHTVFHNIHQFTDLLIVLGGFPFLHILLNICYSLFFHNSHSNRYKVMAH